MMRLSILFFLMLEILPLRPQERQTAHDMLQRALHLADLYNYPQLRLSSRLNWTTIRSCKRTSDSGCSV
jgi:hypothetical protein